MSKKPLGCHHCGKPFRRAPGAGRFCGDTCEKAHAAAMDQHRKSLTDAGFLQHSETPNLWLKDGVAISEEQVKNIGFEKAMRKHQSAAAEHAAKAS